MEEKETHKEEEEKQVETRTKQSPPAKTSRKLRLSDPGERKGFIWGFLSASLIVALVGGIAWAISLVGIDYPQTTSTATGKGVNKVATPAQLLKGSQKESGTIYITKDLKATTSAPKVKGKTIGLVEAPSCSFCYQFNQANAKDIKELIGKDNALKLTIAPVLGKEHGDTEVDFSIIFAYISARHPEKAYDLYTGFFDKFVDDSGTQARKWTVDEYKKLFDSVGIDVATQKEALWATSNPEWKKAVEGWVEKIAQFEGFQGTPYVTVNDKQVDKDLYYLSPGAIKDYVTTGKVNDQFSFEKLRAQAEKAQAEQGK